MKNYFIKLRVSKLEKLQIENKAKKAGLTVSEFIRAVALDKKINATLTEEEIECYINLTKYSDNFRRISNLFKAGDITGIKTEALHTSRLIKSHLEKLKR